MTDDIWCHLLQLGPVELGCSDGGGVGEKESAEDEEYDGCALHCCLFVSDVCLWMVLEVLWGQMTFFFVGNRNNIFPIAGNGGVFFSGGVYKT